MREVIRSLFGSDECFIMKLDESNSSGTHWIAVNIAGATEYILMLAISGISDVRGSGILLQL